VGIVVARATETTAVHVAGEVFTTARVVIPAILETADDVLPELVVSSDGGSEDLQLRQHRREPIGRVTQGQRRR